VHGVRGGAVRGVLGLRELHGLRCGLVLHDDGGDIYDLVRELRRGQGSAFQRPNLVLVMWCRSIRDDGWGG